MHPTFGLSMGCCCIFFFFFFPLAVGLKTARTMFRIDQGDFSVHGLSTMGLLISSCQKFIYFLWIVILCLHFHWFIHSSLLCVQMNNMSAAPVHGPNGTMPTSLPSTSAVCSKLPHFLKMRWFFCIFQSIHAILYVDLPLCSLQPVPHAKNQTVVVENPMTVDESGKLVGSPFL